MRRRTVASLALMAVVMSSCSDSPDDDPPVARTPSAPAGTSPSSSSPPGPAGPSGGRSPDGPGFDCEQVGLARDAAAAAVDEERVRLGVDANSPEGFTVALVATTRTSLDYWQQALDVVPAELEQQAALVIGYWEDIAPQAEQIELVDASPESVQAAGDAVLALNSSQGDDVVDAQERLRRDLDRACPIQ